VSLQTCTRHGEAVVVYNGTRDTDCPLCAADENVDDLKKQIEDITSERDSLQDQVEAIEGDE